MDIQQLKLLAGRVRGLLEQSQHSVGHNQSLDLIAALPGLRNWPEVQAFPDRVATCQLDATSCNRLAFRLKKKFALDLPPQSILAALSPQTILSLWMPTNLAHGTSSGRLHNGLARGHQCAARTLRRRHRRCLGLRGACGQPMGRQH